MAKPMALQGISGTLRTHEPQQIKLSDLASQYSNADLSVALNDYVDFTIKVIDSVSDEEVAAFSSILARGIAIGGRLWHERDWQQVRTRADTIVRLEECRRMCLAYLATWP